MTSKQANQAWRTKLRAAITEARSHHLAIDVELATESLLVEFELTHEEVYHCLTACLTIEEIIDRIEDNSWRFSKE